MYKLLFAFVLFCTSVIAKSQSIIFTTLRAGEIKLEFPLDSVNKYLDKKISIKPNKNQDDYRADTVYALYKGVSLRLAFSNNVDYETKKTSIILEDIYCEDTSIQTKSGIKIGDNKFDIVQRLDGQHLELTPDNERGKKFSLLTIYDDNGKTIIFHFKNNILIAIEVSFDMNGNC
jgi:hypothetical protein